MVNGSEELFSQVTSAALVVYVIEWVKAAGWCAWIAPHTKALSRTLSALLAATAAIGIHFAFDVEAGTLLISGLTVTGLAHGVWHVLNQFISQQVIYDTIAHRNP